MYGPTATPTAVQCTQTQGSCFNVGTLLGHVLGGIMLLVER